MDALTKTRLAELIAGEIAARALHPSTAPFRWLHALLGPVLERDLPMRAERATSRNPMLLALALVLPFALLACLLALPVELLRARRAAQSNARSLALLGSAARDSIDGAVVPSMLGIAGLGTASLLVVDYRLEKRARLAFCGTALVTLTTEGAKLVALTAYRRAPRGTVLDAASLLLRLRKSGFTPAVAFWVWDEEDSLDVTERETRPW